MELMPYLLPLVSGNLYLCVSYYESVVMNQGVFYIQSAVFITLFDTQVLSSSVNGSLFTLVPVSFWHEPLTSLWEFPCFSDPQNVPGSSLGIFCPRMKPAILP